MQLTILDHTANLEHIFVWERRFTEALIAWHHALYHHLRWSVFPSNTNRRRTVIHIHLDIDTSLTYAGTSHYSIFMKSWGTHTSFHGQLYTSRLKEFQLNFRSYRPSQEHRNLCGERMLSNNSRLFAQSLHVAKKTMNNHPCLIYTKNLWLCRRESPISRYRETSENIKMRDWHLLEGWRRYIIVANCDDLVPYFYRTRLFSSAPRHKRLDLDKRKKMIPWETCWSK